MSRRAAQRRRRRYVHVCRPVLVGSDRPVAMLAGAVAGEVYRCAGCHGLSYRQVSSPPVSRPRRRRRYAFAPVVPAVGVLGGLLLVLALLASPSVSTARVREWQRTHPPIAGGAVLTAVAGGGNWDAAATWGGSVPTAASDCVLASTSGPVVINAATNVCRSLDCQASGNYASTLSSSATTSLLSIGTSTTNGSLALRFSTTMTYSPFNAVNPAIQFSSTSATQVQITTAGRPMGTHTFGGAGSYLLADTWVAPIATTSSVTLNAATLNTNGQAITWGALNSNNSSVRTLTLGASSITLTGTGVAWNVPLVTNLTVTANTATVTLTGASASWSSGTVNWNGLSVVMSGSGNATIAGTSPTVANFTRTGTAAKTDLCILSAASLTCSGGTGTFTVNGNSPGANRVLMQTSQVGIQRTITAAVTSLSNVDFMDIAGAGAAAWTGASIGNAGGNAGITFTPGATQYANHNGNWSTIAWGTTSGGSGGRVPLPQDTAVLDGSVPAAGTITIDVPRACGDLTCVAGFASTIATSTASTVYGNITFVAGATVTFTQTVTVAGRGAQTITSAGKSFNSVTVSGFGGTYTLQDNFASSGSLTSNAGGFDANGKNLSVVAFLSNSAITRAVTMGSGTWTLTGTTTVLNLANLGSLTLNAGASTIAVTDAGATGKTLVLGGATLNNLSITAGGAGVITLTGASTWRTWTIGGPKTVVVPSSTVTTVSNVIPVGSAGNVVTIRSSTAGTAATLATPATVGGISLAWVSVQDIAATVATWWATNSTNVSGNSGILFSTPARTFSATNAQAASRGAASVVRAVSAGQAQSAARGAVSAARAFSAGQAQAAVTVGTLARSRAVTQAQAASRVGVAARVLSVGQPQALSLVRSVVRLVAVGQGQAVALSRLLSRQATVAQPSAAAVSRVLVGVRSAGQPQAASRVKLNAVVSHSFSAGQGQAASCRRTAVRAVLGGQGQHAIVQITALRSVGAGQASSSTIAPGVARTVSAGQPQGASRGSAGRSRVFSAASLTRASVTGSRAGSVLAGQSQTAGVVLLAERAFTAGQPQGAGRVSVRVFPGTVTGEAGGGVAGGVLARQGDGRVIGITV